MWSQESIGEQFSAAIRNVANICDILVRKGSVPIPFGHTGFRQCKRDRLHTILGVYIVSQKSLRFEIRLTFLFLNRFNIYLAHLKDLKKVFLRIKGFQNQISLDVGAGVNETCYLTAFCVS